MFGTMKIIAIIIIVCIKGSLMTEFTHDRKRIGPINLAIAEHGCLQKFTVSENTIIRTQDSRILGAKFINESDVGNREDCLNFCCNTQFCDVAVFQEKSPFSCYLFDCGPPDDFVCKFTSHTYYTSAVLTINRHQLDLGLWSTQHQHEAELVDLRSPQGEPEKQNKEILGGGITSRNNQPTRKATTSTTSTTTPPRVLTTDESSNTEFVKTQQPIDRKCSRFQFECHSGECLAIYNACDGIPQCKDGSDEGPNLGCPQGGGDLDLVNSQPLPSKSLGNYPNQANENDWGTQPTSPRRKYGDEKGIFNHRGNIFEYNRFGNDGSQDYPREDSTGYGGHGKGPGYYEYNSRAAVPNRYSSGMAGRQGTDMRNDGSPIYQHDYPDYGQADRQSMQSQLQPIRKQPSLPIQPNLQLKPLQMEANLPMQYQQRPEPPPQSQSWQTHGSLYSSYPMELQPSNQFEPHLNSGYNSPAAHSRIMQTNLAQGNSFLENNQNQLAMRNYANNQLQRNPSYQNAKGLQTMSSQQESNINNNPISQQGIPQVASPIASSAAGGNKSIIVKPTPLIMNQSPSVDSVQTALTIDSLNNNINNNSITNSSLRAPNALSTKGGVIKVYSPLNNTAVKSKAENQSTNLIVAAHSSLTRLEVDMSELTREDETQKSQTSGAVLALSLGLCVTALLIVLVGCRIKGVKRRARRRRGMRSPLEHDADYLVNGMYL